MTNKSQDFLSTIIKELCSLYNEERTKNDDYKLILITLDKFLGKKKLNPDSVISWCLDDHVNPVVQVILAHCYRFGKWVQRDEHKSFIYYQKSADLGNFDGIFQVIYCYQYGVGVNQNAYKALTYYQKLVKMEHSFGLSVATNYYRLEDFISNIKELCNLYNEERSKSKNYKLILNILDNFLEKKKLSSDSIISWCIDNPDNSVTQIILAHCYCFGQWVQKDEYKAFIYYQKFADMSNSDGIFQVGYCYQNGIGVKKNEYMALNYYQKLARIDYSFGLSIITKCYQLKDFFSGVVKKLCNLYNKEKSKDKDYESILDALDEYLERNNLNSDSIIGWCLDNQDNLEIQIILAHCFCFGKWVPKDELKAFIYYQKLANLSNSDGIFQIGYCYHNGIGVKKDEHKAFINYQKAANMSNTIGIYNVGYCYQNGIGVKKNENMAFDYYQKSANMSYNKGIYYVGYCYQNGIGVKKNEYKALTYYQKLAKMDHPFELSVVTNYDQLECFLKAVKELCNLYNEERSKDKDYESILAALNEYLERNNLNSESIIGWFLDNQDNPEIQIILAHCFCFGNWVQKDELKAVIYYQNLANLSNSDGIFQIGYCYHNGIGVKKDEHNAFINYQKAANMNNTFGVYNVGYCYQNGIGVKKNENMAFDYYQQSANMSYDKGIYCAGYCYQNGIGVRKDEYKALTYYQKLAKMDHSFLKEIVKELCNLYNEERSKNKDYKSILNTFDRFLERKELNSDSIISWCLNNQSHFAETEIILAHCYRFGKWVQKDEHKAFIYYQKSANKSAEAPNTDGINSVGYCYRFGIGIEKNVNESFFYYKKSAKSSDATGMFNVGYCYHNGIGVKKNNNTAFFYYQISAKMGNVAGTFNVGYCYQNGIGVKKNENMAFDYYQKSAKMGHAKGNYYVGYCYQNGIGIEKDECEAFKYYQKSADMVMLKE